MNIMSVRFSYRQLTNCIDKFSAKANSSGAKGFGVSSLGKTLLQSDIHIITIGFGKRELFMAGTFHGMEDITARILMKFANQTLDGYIRRCENVLRLLDDVTLYIVPMVNPDGAIISMNEISPNTDIYEEILKMNGGNSDFTKWQANSRGVDINHNFDADWELSRESELREGIIGPGPTRYGGEFPESEIESGAVARLTRERDFERVIAFHSQGEEIYWSFGDKIPKGSRELAKEMERVSGYRAAAPEGMAAFGGYKDWFIKEFDRAGFTIEVGLGENPLPPEQFDEIYPKARSIIETFAEWK